MSFGTGRSPEPPVDNTERQKCKVQAPGVTRGRENDKSEPVAKRKTQFCPWIPSFDCFSFAFCFLARMSLSKIDEQLIDWRLCSPVLGNHA